MISEEKLFDATDEARKKSQNGFYEEAITILESLFDEKLTTLEEAGVLLSLAQISENHDRSKNAINYCIKLIEIYKNNISEIKSSDPDFYDFIGIVLIIKATSHEKLKEFQQAVNDYNDIINIYESNKFPISKMNLLFAYHGLAMIQLRHSYNTNLNNNEKKEILELAKINFEKIIQIDSGYFPAYTQLGVIYSLLENHEESEKMYNKAISLPISQNPKELPENGLVYQYSKINKNLLNNLLNEKIFLNHPKYFNDPFDCPIYHGSNYRKNISVRNVLEKVRISCFSEDNDSILLWSHYADSHKGICIGYKIDSEYIKKNNVHFEKVNYVNKMNDKNSEIGFKSFLNRTFYIKNEVWDYENEYRMLGFDLDDNVINAPEISSITFGINTSESDITAILNIFLDNNEIVFKKITRKEDDYINLKLGEQISM